MQEVQQDPLIVFNDWIDWYEEQRRVQGSAPKFGQRYLCPCCYMPTLDERAGYDICNLCFWEDDGQDSGDAEEVRGGPNHGYSLTEARENFAEHFTMYRPQDKDKHEFHRAHLQLKKQVVIAFRRAITEQSQSLLKQVLMLEDEYHNALFPDQ